MPDKPTRRTRKSPTVPAGRPYSSDTSWSWRRKGSAWQVTRTVKTVWHSTTDSGPGRQLAKVEALFGQLDLPLR